MTSRHTCFLCKLLFPVLMLCAPGLAAMQLNDVRLWRAPDHTSVVFDLSAAPKHKLSTLESPHRIVVDLTDTSLAADISSLPLGNTPIQKVRHGIRAGNDLRIVLDLGEAVKARTRILKANDVRGDRLMLDLYDLTQPTADKPSVKKSVTSSAKRDIVIAIDAGHGGEDPGASGPKKVREKDVVLKIAKQVHHLFEQEQGFKPVLIRSGDYYVGLKKRRDLARSHQADIFVSIHADAFSSPQAKGSSVYTLSQRGVSSTFAKFLAKRENAADLVGGVSLSDKDDQLAYVLYDMSMSHSLDASRGIGGRVLGEMGEISKLHRKQVEQASFAVLKSPDIPSILVETGFISNPEEAKLLSSSSYQRKMGRAIHSGIHTWFLENPPKDTLLAYQQSGRTREYTIARGDTLSEIANRFNVSVSSLRNSNALSGSVIKVGQKLIIPAS